MSDIAFVMMKDALQKAGSHGFDTESELGELSKANQVLSKGSVEEAAAMLRSIRDRGIKARPLFHEAYEMITAAAVAIAEAKVRKLAYLESARPLVEAKREFENRRYEVARQLAERAYQSVSRVLAASRG